MSEVKTLSAAEMANPAHAMGGGKSEADYQTFIARYKATVDECLDECLRARRDQADAERRQLKAEDFLAMTNRSCERRGKKRDQLKDRVAELENDRSFSELIDKLYEWNEKQGESNCRIHEECIAIVKEELEAKTAQVRAYETAAVSMLNCHKTSACTKLQCGSHLCAETRIALELLAKARALDNAAEDEPASGWCVNLICCGRDDGIYRCSTYDEAEEFRETYTSGPGVGARPDGSHGHIRTGIIVRDNDTKPFCAKCKDTGVIQIATGGGTEPRAPGTPQVIGTRLSNAMCTDRDCLARRMSAADRQREQQKGNYES